MKTTELVFILDRSGSMSGLEKDTIGGYNSLLKKQKGRVNVTTVLFDDRYELLHDRVSIKDVKPISEEDYYVRGCTALLDAVGKTINKMKKFDDGKRQFMIVISTDGYENASREFSVSQIRDMISAMKEKGWEFIFLGANIDAIATAGSLGIDKDRAANYMCDAEGTQLNFRAMSKAVSSFVETSALNDDWSKEIDEYFESRK